MRGTTPAIGHRVLNAAGGALLVAGVLVPTAHAVAATGGDLYITEYVEGSVTNQAIELYNPTDMPISLGAGGYHLEFYFDGSPSVSSGVLLLGTIQPAHTWVVTPTDASSELQAKANQKFGTSAWWFDGNDAVVLSKMGTALDVIGQIGFDPGSEWGTGLTSTRDNTLRRKTSVTTGDPDGTDAFDPSVEWNGFAQDAFDALGFYPDPLPNQPLSLTCPASLATTQPQDVTGAISATDPDGTVVSFAVSSVTPSDPGTMAVANVSPASAVGGTATADLDVDGTTPAASYTVTVTASNDDATPQTASCDVPVTVSPFVSAFDGLRAMVDGFVADGSVRASKAFLLSDRLDRAAADLADGRAAAYEAQLQAFVNQVAGLSPRWVTPAAAAELEAQARLALASA